MHAQKYNNEEGNGRIKIHEIALNHQMRASWRLSPSVQLSSVQGGVNDISDSRTRGLPWHDFEHPVLEPLPQIHCRLHRLLILLLCQ